MSLGQVIGIIGQIATWVTVFLVFLTLREMEKQRRASQKPELIIPKVPLYAYIRERSELPVPTEWSNKEIKVSEISRRGFAEVTLYNIGFGAAKNINLNWQFDMQKIMQTIKDYCYQNSIPVVVSIQNAFLKTEIKGSASMTKIDAFSNREHEYLMPASVTSRGLASDLPLTFMNLLSVWMYMMIHEATKKSSSTTVTPAFEFPDMKLYLSYEDVGGSKYKKEFDVKFLLFMFQLPQKEIDFQEKEKIVEGMFEFTEIRV